MKLNMPIPESLTRSEKNGLRALLLVAAISLLLFIVKPKNMGLMAFAAFLALQAVSGVLFGIGAFVAVRLLFGAPGKPGLVRKAADRISKMRNSQEPRQQPEAA